MSRTEKRREYMRKYMRIHLPEYRKNNPDKIKKWDKTSKENLKIRVLDYLGGRVCVNCGTTDIRALEINHKDGGGWEERQNTSYWSMLRSIIKEQRKEEFDVRCRVCNAAYYLEKKYGIKYTILPITIVDV